MTKTTIALLLSIAGTSIGQAATLYTPTDGSTGLQTFKYQFANDFNGTITIGVSDEGDISVDSYLDLFDNTPYWNAQTLDTDPENQSEEVDTSAFSNSQGEPGVNGQTIAFNYAAAKNALFEFTWQFRTDDEDPYNDFAFVSIVDSTTGPVHYAVLAETSAVPLPGAAWLFGSAVIAMTGLRRSAFV